MPVTKAVVLVGGLGTRLRSVVSDVPKPLAPVAGRPFLAWLLDRLAQQGISQTLLCVSYGADVIEQTMGHRWQNMQLRYVQEPRALGTGGATWQALDQVQGDRAFVMNGDSWCNVNLQHMAQCAPHADITMAVCETSDRARYGGVTVQQGRVSAMLEKGLQGPGPINLGLYVLSRSIVSTVNLTGAWSLEQQVLSACNRYHIAACVTESQFLDIGTPHDYHLAQTLIPQWVRDAEKPEESC